MGPAGMIETLNPAGTHGWVFPARSPDENTEAFLKVFEWQYSDVENYITGQDGVKGQHWQWVEEGETYEYIGNRALFEDYRFAVGLPVEVQARVLSPEIEFWSEYLINGTDDLDGIKHPFDVSIVISILLIFNIGNLINAGFEQILLLYSPVVYDVSDIIDTYVYREGLQQLNFSYAAAVDVFKSVIALLMVVGANFTAKKLEQEGLW